jgi:hypothetical protein
MNEEELKLELSIRKIREVTNALPEDNQLYICDHIKEVLYGSVL